MRKPLICLLALSAGLLVVSPAFAQFFQNWWHVPPFTQTQSIDKDSSAVPVRQGTFVEWERSMAPGVSGDWYFTWSATPSGERGLYAGRVRANGSLAWTCTVNDGPGRQEDPVIMGTPDGGAIIAWVDYRVGPYNGDSTLHGDGGGSILAQKIDSNGVRLWVSQSSDTVHAVPVCMVLGYQNDIRLIPDDAGGCFIFWEDTRNFLGEDIYGTRLNANGIPYAGFRPNGNPVVVAAGNQPVPGEYTVDVDMRHGAWIAWTDNRRLSPNVYIQRMRGDGTTEWDSTGHPFDTTAGEKNKVKLCPDGRGGAFLAWRNNNQVIDLLMQRIDSVGNRRWATDTSYYYFDADSNRIMIDSIGVPVGKWDNEQTNPRIVYSTIDTCIVSWEDFRNDPSGTNNEDLYVQKLTGNTRMVRAWNIDGVPVCTQTDHQRESRLCTDGTGGCVLVWEDERNGAAAPFQDNYTQRINTAGNPVWTVNGTPLAAFDKDQILSVCRESNGHLLFMWTDGRNGSMPIYRTVWDLNGAVVGSLALNGTETIPDIAGLPSKNMLVKQGSTRVINFWIDGRRSSYGQRIYYFQNNIGNSLATGGQAITTVPNGISITNDTTNTITQDCPVNFSYPIAVATPDSGAIIIYRNIVGSVNTLRAQKISYDGSRMWGNSGVEVCAQADGFEYFTGVPDGNGGVYFAYIFAGAAPNYYNEIHFQHINSSGTRQLATTGVPIATGTEQSWASLSMSGSNLYLGYVEVYDETYSLSRVRLVKLNPDGSAIWSRTVVTGFDSSGTHGPKGIRLQLKLIPATNGSVVAYWKEFLFDVAGGSGGQIYAQKVNSDGTFAWGTSGLRLGPSTEDESNAVGIAAGNTYWFCWQDARDIGYSSLYLQHVNDNGDTLLAAVGQQLRSDTQAQNDQVLVPDANTGMYAAYVQFIAPNNPYPPPDTTNDCDIIGTHILSDGSLNRPEVWHPAPYANVSTQLAYIVKNTQLQYKPFGVPFDGGGIFNWIDARPTSKEEFDDIYIQRILDDNRLGVKEVIAPIPQAFSLKQNYPNPFNSTTIIRFALPSTERVKVAVYDVLGREVARLVDDVKMTGTYEVRWNSTNREGMKVASGIYFYRLTTPQGSITKKMTLLN